MYGFPKERATRIALAETLAFLESSLLPREVVFVCFSAGDFGVYQIALDAAVGPEGAMPASGLLDQGEPGSGSPPARG